MTIYQPPKGMKDITQEEMQKRKWIYAVVHQVLDSYNYKEICPTELEMWETLAAKAGEENLNEVYDFKDKAQRRLALRFDLTCGIARMVASMRQPKPIKLYCIGNSWRYDAPQKGRYRCFTQWDAELFGISAEDADAEMIQVSCEIFNNLNIDYEVKINNRKFVESVLNYLNIDKKQYADLMRIIDKIPKLSKSDIKEEFKKAGLKENTTESLLNILARKGQASTIIPALKKEFKNNKDILGSIETLENLFAKLGPISKKCILDLSIVRGIGYYTGIVFEAFDKKQPNLGSLFAGGRFDTLIGIYGTEDMPAVGVGGGMERLIEVLEQNRSFDKMQIAKSVFIAPVNDAVRTYASKIAASFRKNGFITELDLTGRNLKKQFDYANKKQFDYITVIGDKEKESKTFMLRDMKTGKEKKMNYNS